MLAAIPGADLTGGRLHGLGTAQRDAQRTPLAALQQLLATVVQFTDWALTGQTESPSSLHAGHHADLREDPHWQDHHVGRHLCASSA